MSEVGRLIRDARRAVPVRERTTPKGSVRYCCEQCFIRVRVVLCLGVGGAGAEGIAVAPEEISCGFCDGKLRIVDDSFERGAEELAAPYLRIPARRRRTKMGNGGIEAQLVANDE